MTDTATPKTDAAKAGLIQRLRSACTDVRRKFTPLSVLIPMMQQAADLLEAPEPFNPEPAPGTGQAGWKEMAVTLPVTPAF